jgi:hypothetical protein
MDKNTLYIGAGALGLYLLSQQQKPKRTLEQDLAQTANMQYVPAQGLGSPDISISSSTALQAYLKQKINALVAAYGWRPDTYHVSYLSWPLHAPYVTRFTATNVFDTLSAASKYSIEHSSSYAVQVDQQQHYWNVMNNVLADSNAWESNFVINMFSPVLKSEYAHQFLDAAKSWAMLIDALHGIPDDETLNTWAVEDTIDDTVDAIGDGVAAAGGAVFKAGKSALNALGAVGKTVAFLINNMLYIGIGVGGYMLYKHTRK